MWESLYGDKKDKITGKSRIVEIRSEVTGVFKRKNISVEKYEKVKENF